LNKRNEEDLLIASQYNTVFDLSKTRGIKGKHIHCQFTYKHFIQGGSTILRELEKQGATSIFFKDVGVIDLKSPPPQNPMTNDPTISYWLKEQLEIAQKRDPLDALNDAEMLVSILKEKFKQLSMVDV